MAHLTEQQRHRLLARSLPPGAVIAAIEHVRTCASCRDGLVALRSNRPGSLHDQIVSIGPEEHPSDDLLAAYADNYLEAAERATIADHLDSCEFCREIIADLGHFRDQLQQLPAKNYTPSLQQPRDRNQRRQWSRPAFWDGVAEWFTKPLSLGIPVAAVVVVIVGLVATRSFLWPAQNQPSVDTIQDGSLTFRVSASGQLTPSSASLPDDAVAVLVGSILDLAHSQFPSLHLMRGVSETPGVTASDSKEETKLPTGEYFFSRKIFGTIVALPRATPDPDVQPNGIVISETIPVLSWSPVSDSSQTLTVRDCATDQVIVETQVPENGHSFAIPVALQRGGFYLWQVAGHATDGRAPEKAASGRFKVASDSDLRSIASPAALSSHLLKAFLLARAGLFAEAEAELTKLEASNPKSQTIAMALEYVRRLEGN